MTILSFGFIYFDKGFRLSRHGFIRLSRNQLTALGQNLTSLQSGFESLGSNPEHTRQTHLRPVDGLTDIVLQFQFATPRVRQDFHRIC